ncbi:MAG: four helix bundle protein [Bacteroidetes bacterium]|nr:four helix bundle protein [Bacteroidota bacterium]
MMEKKTIDLFDFEKLSVYQKSLNFVDHVYSITNGFPVDEKYNLTSQFKRAACSISLNIGEGSGGSRKEFIQFLNISKRSLRECIVCITLCSRRKYVTELAEQNLRDELTEISKMINGLINYLESDKAKQHLSESQTEYTSNSKLSTFYQDLFPNSKHSTQN